MSQQHNRQRVDAGSCTVCRGENVKLPAGVPDGQSHVKISTPETVPTKLSIYMMLGAYLVCCCHPAEGGGARLHNSLLLS